MRLSKEDIAALESTIEAVGFAGKVKSTECLAFSPADSTENKAVHSKANEQLLEVLIKPNNLGHCIHITGEMRALADPFHRRLCAELAKRGDTRFTVVYDIPEEYRNTPEGVGEWNSKRWASKAWTEKLSAMNLIGDALVDVRASNTLQEIQYSVFGNRYVLLQEKHLDDETSKIEKPKRVWLLNSEKLNEYLTDKALRIVRDSDDIPEGLFKRFFTKVNGVSSQNVLMKLMKNESLHISEVLDKDLLDFNPQAEADLEILKIISFVQVDEQLQVRITHEGKHYLDTMKG